MRASRYHSIRDSEWGSHGIHKGVQLLATLAQKWKLRLKSGHPAVLDPLFTLRPKFGLRMVAELR